MITTNNLEFFEFIYYTKLSFNIIGPTLNLVIFYVPPTTPKMMCGIYSNAADSVLFFLLFSMA